MLSLVDAVLQMSKPEVLERLNVDEEIRVAVIERERPLGRLLALSEALEQGDFSAVARDLEELGLAAESLLEAELQVSAWVRGLESGEAD